MSVIGAGTMGNGIAHVFAQHGFKVHLVDVSNNNWKKLLITISKNLDRQVAKEIIRKEKKEETLLNIITTTSIQEGVKNARLIVEAATENVELKLKIFKEIDAASPDRLYSRHQYFFYFDHKDRISNNQPGNGDRHAFHEPGTRNETGRDHQWLCHQKRSD